PVKLPPVTTSLVQPDTTLDFLIQMPPLDAAPAVPAPPPIANPPAQLVESLPAEPAETRTPSTADTSIRVDVNLLDKLMTLMGELVLARNQILQYSALHEDSAFQSTVQRLNLLT